jgi:hypothetical protein
MLHLLLPWMPSFMRHDFELIPNHCDRSDRYSESSTGCNGVDRVRTVTGLSGVTRRHVLWLKQAFRQNSLPLQWQSPHTRYMG